MGENKRTPWSMGMSKLPAVEARAKPALSAPCWGSAGFTLLELLLATFISALVIGILSVTLSVTLRVWEKNRGNEPGDKEVVRLLEVMTLQLATFNPVPMILGDDKQQQWVFFGNRHVLSFASTYSIKSISRGAPVICRYVFVPGSGRLYYAEMPMDPYHSDPLKQFLKSGPSEKDSWPRYYSMEMQLDDLRFGYRGQDFKDYADVWEETKSLPLRILVHLTVRQDKAKVEYARVIDPRFMQFQ
ncbi:MAG TPA: hypothetical protein DCZ69_05145 [Syntrophobacteraceae bacterium]|nr:hypothetical protein [Syntrophobacteraceae bacterium]